MRTIVKEWQWRMRWPRRLRTPPRGRGTRSRNAKIHIKWRKRIARLRISVGKAYGDGDDGTEKGRGKKSELAESQVSAGTNAEHRDRGAHRRRQDDDHRARAVLHRQDSQDGRGARRHDRHGLDGR